MQIGRKMTELEAFELLSVVLEHPVFAFLGNTKGPELLYSPPINPTQRKSYRAAKTHTSHGILKINAI